MMAFRWLVPLLPFTSKLRSLKMLVARLPVTLNECACARSHLRYVHGDDFYEPRIKDGFVCPIALSLPLSLQMQCALVYRVGSRGRVARLCANNAFLTAKFATHFWMNEEAKEQNEPNQTKKKKKEVK